MLAVIYLLFYEVDRRITTLIKVFGSFCLLMGLTGDLACVLRIREQNIVF